MSVEAISWALNLAPVPADRGGQPSSACKFVLAGLANHAGPDGTGAFASVAHAGALGMPMEPTAARTAVTMSRPTCPAPTLTASR